MAEEFVVVVPVALAFEHARGQSWDTESFLTSRSSYPWVRRFVAPDPISWLVVCEHVDRADGRDYDHDQGQHIQPFPLSALCALAHHLKLPA